MNPYDKLPLNPRDFLILFALSEGDLHGYGIVKQVEDLSTGEVLLDPANLYRSVKKLIREELIEEASRGIPEESGGPKRKYYSITPFGGKVFEAEAARLAKLTDVARARKIIAQGQGGGVVQ